MQLDALDVTIRDYIKEVKEDYESQIHKLKNEIINYQNKYLAMKEQRDLLLYKRYAQSAEKVLSDEKQPLLFTTEAEAVEMPEKEETDESIEVKPYSRKKSGRKPIDRSIRREERIIDIPEEEKTCACGAKLTRIGEETSESCR